MATEKQTSYAPVSRMTLADMNKKNQAFHSNTVDAGGSMMTKAQQLDPGDTVHNGRGLRAKVVRVEGGRVVVKCPDGSEQQWDLSRVYPAAESHDDSPATEELLEAAELNAEAMREFVEEENEEPAHQTGDAYGDPAEIKTEYDRLKRLDRDSLQREFDRSHKVNSAKGEPREVIISQLLRDKYGDRRVDAAFQ